MARRLAAAGAVIALIAISCGGSSLELSPDEQQGIAQTGWNNTGRVDLSVDEWVSIAERGCERGAWDPAVQRAIAAEWDLERHVTVEEAMMAVFLVSVQACPDRFPAGVVRG